MRKFNQKGAAPVLILIAVIGLISFLAIGSFASFKNDLFSSLFPKSTSQAATNIDVTSQVETLGNPFTDKPLFSRNIWDMQIYNGKVYLGHGDSVANTGPIPLRVFDPMTSQFSVAGTINGEVIESMRVLNGKLYIPDFDPKPAGGWYWSWDGTNLLNRQVSTTAQHDGDMYFFNNALYITASPNSPAGVLKSTDNGVTWRSVGTGGGGGDLFEINGNLYHSDASSQIHRINQDDTITDFPLAQFAPDAGGRIGYFYRSATFGLTTILIFDSGFQWHSPFGLYKTTGPGNSSKITLPSGVMVHDLLTRSDGVYLLSSTVISPGQIQNTVSKFDGSLTTPVEVFHFTSSTFARSFEEVNGDWYFGLGDDPIFNTSTGVTDYSKLSTIIGNVLRVKASSINPSPSPTSPPISAPVSPTPNPLPGDIILNGKVDIFDYNALLQDFGKTSGFDPASDIVVNGKIDIFDYNGLLQNFGKTTP